MTLGSFLRAIRLRNDETIAAVTTRAKGLSPRPKGAFANIRYFSEVETGVRRAPKEHLPFLAAAYQCDVLTLLFNLPADSEGPLHLSADQGFQKAPFVDPDATGAQYMIPLHKLRESDVALVFLTLAPGGNSRRNHWHPGNEIVTVQEGTVYLLFPELPRGVNEHKLVAGDLLHFNATYQHWVENRSKKTARLLIMRRF